MKWSRNRQNNNACVVSNCAACMPILMLLSACLSLTALMHDDQLPCPVVTLSDAATKSAADSTGIFHSPPVIGTRHCGYQKIAIFFESNKRFLLRNSLTDIDHIIDSPWTSNPLKFDNSYFTVCCCLMNQAVGLRVDLNRFSAHTHRTCLYAQTLLNNKWVKRKWDGPEQFEDEATGLLMMLPTDLVRTQVPPLSLIVLFAKL